MTAGTPTAGTPTTDASAHGPAPGSAAAPADGALAAQAARGLARMRMAQPDLALSPGDETRLAALLEASDFALETCLRQPALLPSLLADDGAACAPAPVLSADNRAEWPGLLRRWRQAESVRLIWRDVHGLDTLDETLACTSRLAEHCLRLALEALEGEFAARHGQVRGVDAAPVRLVVFALGKLGGGELNFSSDIDLVYGYAENGESDGARTLAAEDYFARLGQQLAKLLDENTADGFCHRVDLRLRPFGSVGRVALSFAAMEQYFQREGRDWERYAWQKARPVAGDIEAGVRFLQTLRPFVYRRYLDYGALDGLREMKASIAAEVARRDMADDIKRGPGGIREVEFLAQALQLIRGGREPALREPRLQPALRALAAARHLEEHTVDALLAAYRFLRHLENRLQMLRDAQTQRLPEDALDRLRIARGLGFTDWDGLNAVLSTHRARVSEEFAALLAPRQAQATPAALTGYWRALPDGGEADALAAAGFDTAAMEEGDRALRDFARSPGVRDLSDAARARLDRVMPALLEAVAASDAPLLALRRLLATLHPILRRASYLALLDEQPAALTRLIDVLLRSALLGDRLARHPLLLDELLDVRVGGPLPGREAFETACREALRFDDSEAALLALNEARQLLSFRIALATLDGRQSAEDSARALAGLADAIVRAVHAVASAELHAQHGRVPGLRFAALGYGSLGGEELGFTSDLDLVFLYDFSAGPSADTSSAAGADIASDGARPLDPARWTARLAQKIVALLSTPTAAGRLYEVDVRLRPDGAKGLLVSTLVSFEDYQRQRAWTWEHQALVRARAVAGDAGLCAEFERVRAQTLAQPREAHTLAREVREMRARMRTELDRSEHDPVEHSPVEHAPVEHAPIEHAPVVDAPAEHAPAEHAPFAHAPPLDAPAAPAHSERAHPERASSEQASSEQASSELASPEHAPTRAARFDLKQGEGGLVDLEFLLQYLVLRDAARTPALLLPRDTPGLIAALAHSGALAADEAERLHAAHATLLEAGLRCTLDRRKRLMPVDAALRGARAAVRAVWVRRVIGG